MSEEVPGLLVALTLPPTLPHSLTLALLSLAVVN